jgi:zinc transport system substrate-binding protein
MLECRKVYTSWSFLVLSTIILIAAGCEPGGDEQAKTGDDSEQPRPVVIAVNYPLANVAHQLAGEWIDLQYPVPADVDPAYWRPGDEQVTAMQQANLLLLNGAGHEPWREQVVLSPLNLAITSRGFHDQWIQVEDAVTHQHGPEGSHTHSGIASTTWLDPILFREQIHVIAQTLIKLSPDQREEILKREKKLDAELDQLDQQWKAATKILGDRPLIASHPVYQYLAKRYGWKVDSLHWEPGQKLAKKEWEQFDKLREKNKATFMIWEAEPLAETKAELDKRGIKIVVIKPLSNGSPEENVLDEMKANAMRFETVLSK